MTIKKKTAAAKKSTTPAVIVRAYSGVFFGFLVAKDGASVTLKGARQVWSWDSAGLPEPSRTCGDIATRGLGSGSKVSGPADAIVEQVGAVFFCTPAAVLILQAQKWNAK